MTKVQNVQLERLQRCAESAWFAAHWLDKDMHWHGCASGKQGRSPKCSEAANQFCLTTEGLFNLALRQAMGTAQSLLKLADWTGKCLTLVPLADARNLAVAMKARPTAMGLHLLVDSIDIEMLSEGECKTKKRRRLSSSMVHSISASTPPH